MRCISCNIGLSDFESTRKDGGGEYLDMCSRCYGTVADDLTNVKSEDTLMPVIEDNDYEDIPSDLTEADLFNDDDPRS